MSLDLGEYLSRSDAGQVLMEKGFVVIPEAIPTKMMAEHVANMKHYAMYEVDNKAGPFHGNFSDPRWEIVLRRCARRRPDELR